MTKPAHNKRDDLIRAALELFAARGIRATTVREIAAAAGVTEGALYRHFESKEALAQSLFAECARMLYDHLASAVAPATTSRERLCALSRGFLEFAREQPEAYEYVMARHHDDVGGVPPDQPLPKEVFTRVMAQGMAAGEIRRMDTNLAAAMMIGLCLRTVFFFQRGLIQATAEETAQEVCDALQRVFLTQ
jgi:AcrR family transcriptional regulator